MLTQEICRTLLKMFKDCYNTQYVNTDQLLLPQSPQILPPICPPPPSPSPSPTPSPTGDMGNVEPGESGEDPHTTSV